MTDAVMALRTMLEKGTDADVLREMIGFAAQRLMELEVQGRPGAGQRHRPPARLVQRIACPREGGGLPGSRLGDPCRHRRTAHPEAAQGELLPRIPGAAAHG